MRNVLVFALNTIAIIVILTLALAVGWAVCYVAAVVVGALAGLFVPVAVFSNAMLFAHYAVGIALLRLTFEVIIFGVDKT